VKITSTEPTVIDIPVNEYTWIEASEFNLMEFRFQLFNPVQSAYLKVVNGDANTVLSAETSVGKTVIAEMAFSRALADGKNCIYLCPLKALAQEKLSDWTSPGHSFSRRRIAIATGDYILPENRDRLIKECAEADITVMTSELLDSLTRRIGRVKDWFRGVGVIVVDEGHLLTMPIRGSALECALMRFSAHSDARIVFLSATMPNTTEIARWLCRLNNKNTYLISSKWRPCQLDVHYISYPDNGSYGTRVEEMTGTALSLIDRYRDDKFIVFVHSKAIGRKLVSELKDYGIKSEFHNADLDRAERIRIEEEFKNGGDLMVVVATSTLAYGLNLPARRVIVCGVQRGCEDVSVLDIKQMIGRSGRVGLDPKGDAYILIPESKRGKYNNMLIRLPDIESRLSEKDELAFHIVSEINEGVNTPDALWRWFNRSFACIRGVGRMVIDAAVEDLIRWGVVTVKNGRYINTYIGRVASWFYFSPYVMAILKNNMEVLDENTYNAKDIAWAIGSAFPGYPVSSELRDDVNDFIATIDRDIPYDRALNCYALYLILKGRANSRPEITSIIRGFQADSQRVISAMKVLGGFYAIKQDFDTIGMMLQYGVPAEAAQLCRLDGIGAVRARKLYNAGIRTIEDFIKNRDRVASIIGKKTADAIFARVSPQV